MGGMDTQRFCAGKHSHREENERNKWFHKPETLRQLSEYERMLFCQG